MESQSTVKNYICPYCQKDCGDKMTLEMHIPRFHRDKISTPPQTYKPAPITFSQPITPQASRQQTKTPEPQQEIKPQKTQQEELIVEYNIKESLEEFGELEPVKEDAFGNIYDGNHRLKINPNWTRERNLKIDTPIKSELAALIVNFDRRKMTDQEFTERITKLVKLGVKPEEIAKKTGIHIRKIYRFLPQALKSAKSIKISEGMRAKTFTNVNCKNAVPLNTAQKAEQAPDVTATNPEVTLTTTNPEASFTVTSGVYSEPETTTPAPTYIETPTESPAASPETPACICPHCHKPITTCPKEESQ